ncbi:MAG: regulatory protein RecX [Flavobacteriaceae bacterium]
MQKQTSFTVQEAQKKLEHYCAYQERCHQEVVQKLKSLNMIPTAIDEIIGQLIINDYLNETRFAQSFARGKFRIKKWGKNRILRQLKFRGISDWNIKKGMAEIEADEYLNTFEALFSQLWKQFNHLGNSKCQKKVFDRLQYRGWENELIYKAINNKKQQTLKN